MHRPAGDPVMNKCDLVPSLLDIPMIGNAVRISAKTGEGIGDLLAAVRKTCRYRCGEYACCCPLTRRGWWRRSERIMCCIRRNTRPTDFFSALLDPVLYGRVREYEILENT